MDDLASRIRALAPSLGAAGRLILSHIERHPAEVLASTAREIGAKCGTSDASVVRTAKALGYRGLPELKQAIIEAAGSAVPSPGGNMRRTLSDVTRAEEAIASVFTAHREGLHRLETDAASSHLLKAVAALAPAQRIWVFGAGPTGALATYTAALLNRIGRRSQPLIQGGTMLADSLLDMQAGDAVLCLAYGRPYPEITAVLGEATRRGLVSVLITDDLSGEIAQGAGLAVPVSRGRRGQLAQHSVTLLVLEALVLALAAAAPETALLTLDRLDLLRKSLAQRL